MNDVQDAARAKLVDAPTPARTQFKRLLAANPNHFGTMPDLGKVVGIDLPVIEPIKADTTYEGLACVSFSPERDRLEATIAVKQSVGYGGGLCSRGTREYVRFYVEQGGSWVDAGLGGAPVYDIPTAPDCGKVDNHPLYPVVGVDFAPFRSWCFFPQLPRVRAILSWEVAPPPGQPDWIPVWGDVREVNIQVKARRLVIFDVLDKLPEDIVAVIPEAEKVVPHPIPDPDPAPVAKVLSLSEVAELSRKDQIPAHRFALPHLQSAIAHLSGGDGPILAQTALQAKFAGIDLSEILKVLDDGSGNTEYEQLRCVGLDEARSALVATFQVKKTSGYSGGPCTSGSYEYVAFWADWDDTCNPTYLGTVQVLVHDYPSLPPNGLSYAAVLPIDLGALRRPCDGAKVSRIRAVLSWGTPPSTTDPDAPVYWGNRIDRHVQVSPGIPYDGVARFTIVGGVPAQDVDPVTGLTKPSAVLAETGVELTPSGWAFAGLVTLHGPVDPALFGTTYRLVAHNVDTGATMTLTSPFSVVDNLGFHHTVTPDPLTGNVLWPTTAGNTTGALGAFAPGGDDRWDVELQVGPSFVTVAVARVRMDSILRTTVEPGDSLNAGDLVVNTAAQCFVDKTVPLTGTFVALDEHFGSWGISVHGGPGGPITVPPADTGGLATTSQTPLTGTAFSLNISSLVSCGYVVQLSITDRVVVSSTVLGRTAIIERGICVK